MKRISFTIASKRKGKEEEKTADRPDLGIELTKEMKSLQKKSLKCVGKKLRKILEGGIINQKN